MKKGNERRQVVFILIAFAIFLACIAFFDKPSKNTSSINDVNNYPSLPTHSPAECLAKIDNGNYKWYDKEDYHVLRIDALLSQLSDEFNEPKEQIADETVNGSTQLAQHGLTVSNYDILKELTTGPSLKGQHTKYSELVALYVMTKLYNLN